MHSFSLTPFYLFDIYENLHAVISGFVRTPMLALGETEMRRKKFLFSRNPAI